MPHKSNEQSKLEKLLGQKRGQTREKVVYGIYDNRGKPLFTRLNDFFIDNTPISLKDKAYFFHLLAVMIDSGMSMIESIETLANQQKNERLSRILDTIEYNLRQGISLSKAISRFPNVFKEKEIGVIKSGEAAGNLDQMLMKLAEDLDKANELQIKLVTASIYPIFVIVVMLLVSAGMLIFVIPELMNLLTEGGLQEEDFPLMTKILIGVSNFMLNWWWLVVAIGAIVYFAWSYWKNTEEGRYSWDLFKMNIPVVGEMVRKVYVLRFVSTLGLLLESGLPVIKALEIVATSMSSGVYALKTWEVISRVKNGEKISDSLKDTPFLFDDTVTRMMSVGEKTASINKIAMKISAHYDQEIDHTLKRVTGLFEPIMILTIGILVALLALAILMPVFQLSSVVA